MQAECTTTTYRCRDCGLSRVSQAYSKEHAPSQHTVVVGSVFEVVDVETWRRQSSETGRKWIHLTVSVDEEDVVVC